MVHYAVVVDGKVIGSRSSKSHAQQVYTHALVHTSADQHGVVRAGVVSYHGSVALAMGQRLYWGKQWGIATLSIVPVDVTAKRAKVGTSLEQLATEAK